MAQAKKKVSSRRPENGAQHTITPLDTARRLIEQAVADFGKEIEHIDEAIFIFEAVFPGVQKIRTNTYTNSKYANLDDLMNAAQPFLTVLKLSFSYPIYQAELPDKSIQNMQRCVLLHLPSGETKESSLALPGLDLGAQSLGSYSTYWRRYMAAGLLNIREGEDDDGASALPDPTAPVRLTEKQHSEILDWAEATNTEIGKIDKQGTLLFHINASMNCETIDQLSTKQAGIILKMLKTKAERQKKAELEGAGETD